MLKAFCIACLIAIQVPLMAQESSNPWFGTWKLRLKDSSEKPETLIYSDAGNGTMRMVSVEENSIIVTRFDGTPSVDLGKPETREPALAVKATSSVSYTWIFFRNGKPYVEGRNTLAADGKTFTEISWLVTDPKKTVSLIYDRQ